MDWTSLVPYLALGLGVLARVIVPWYIKRLQSGIAWDWSKANAQLLGGFVAFLALVAANPDVSTMTGAEALTIGLGSALVGWGAADAGRTAKKGVSKED